METVRFGLASVLLIAAIAAVLALSVYAYIPSAQSHSTQAIQFDGGKVESGGTSNRSTSTIPVTTSTIPPSKSTGNNTAPTAPKITIKVARTSTYNVVLNGTITPGSNSVTIKALNVTWGDNSRTNNAVLPLNHTYKSTGTFLITATVYQSDNQINSAVVSVLINGTTSATKTTVPSVTTVPQTSARSTVATSIAATTIAQQASSSSASSSLIYVAVIIVVIIIVIVVWALTRKKKK